MSARKTTGADAGQVESPAAQFRKTPQYAVATSAIHEIGELSILVRRINATTDDDAKRDALIRGMLVRIEGLAEAAMVCIDLHFNCQPVEALRAFVECDETDHFFGAGPVVGGAA